MRRRWKLILFAIVLPLALIGGCGALVARKMRPQNDPPKTAKVERGDVEVTVRETGRVEPIKRVDVKSKVAGKILQLAVDEGDVVTEGQLIARLDVPEVEAQRDQIRAQHDAARARLEQTRLSREQSRQMIESQVAQAEAGLRAARFALREAETRRQDAQRIYDDKKRLLDMGGYVSENEVASAKASAELARQQEESAKQHILTQEAALAIAIAGRTECEVNESRVVESEAYLRQVQDSLAEVEARLRDAVILAPCSGTIISRHIREGEMISAVTGYGDGAPLVTIGDLSTMLVKVDLNEVDVHDVALGLPVEITVDALRDQSFTGEVTRVSPASASAANSYAQGQAEIVRFPTEITILGSTAGIRPGMTANADIQCEVARDVLWVPNDAIFEKEDEEGKLFVAVVTGRKNGHSQSADAGKEEGKASAAADEGETKRQASEAKDAGKGKGGPLSGLKGAKEVELITEDREVTVGLRNDSRTEIRSGLEEGEEIERDKAAIPERKIIDIRMESKNEDEEE